MASPPADRKEIEHEVAVHRTQAVLAVLHAPDQVLHAVDGRLIAWHRHVSVQHARVVG